MHEDPRLIIDIAQLSSAYPWLFPVWEVLEGLIGTPRVHLYWVGLIPVAFLIATYLIYEAELSRKPEIAKRGYFRFTFPKKIYGSHNVRTDTVLLVINGLFFKLPFFITIFSATVASLYIRDFLTRTFGAPPEWILSLQKSRALVLGYYVGIFLLNDFGQFFVHLLAHRIRFLWEFHTVHHSAEVLTSFTAFREHPVLVVFQTLLVAIFMSFFQGLAQYFIPEVATASQFLTGSLFSYVVLHTSFLFGHYWMPLSYGPLDKVMVSPAIHRIHHSAAVEHHDKNFGSRITLWDYLFGTLYIPTDEELQRVEVGVHEHRVDARVTHEVFRLYWGPFVRNGRRLKNWIARKPAHPKAPAPNVETLRKAS